MTLQIRDKEVQVFTDNFGECLSSAEAARATPPRTSPDHHAPLAVTRSPPRSSHRAHARQAVLSTQSAFLTGLGFGGLTMVPTWGSGDDDDYRGVEVVFFTLVSISIGFNILVLCISSWCMIFGPGLAIRGPEGDSMSRAVLGMYQERKWALRFFWVGLMFTLFSGVALGWLKFQRHTAITMTTIFLSFILIFIIYVKNVTRPRFAFDKDSSRSPKEFTLDGYGSMSNSNVPEGAGLPTRQNKLST